jgi:hypothetical protein
MAASIGSDDSKFSQGLVDTLVEDLSSSGRIRAAELQLIAAKLKRQGARSLADMSLLEVPKAFLARI